MKKVFNIIYNRLLELKLSENILCSDFWRKIKALNSNFNEEQCWNLLTEHFDWLINSKVTTTLEILSWLRTEELEAHNIFSRGSHKISDSKAIGIGTSRIEAAGHSKILLFDRAHCEAYDSSFIRGFHNSTFELKECTGEAFNDCKAVAGFNSKIEAWDNSFITAKDWSFVIQHKGVTVATTTRAVVIEQ